MTASCLPTLNADTLIPGRLLARAVDGDGPFLHLIESSTADSFSYGQVLEPELAVAMGVPARVIRFRASVAL